VAFWIRSPGQILHGRWRGLLKGFLELVSFKKQAKNFDVDFLHQQVFIFLTISACTESNAWFLRPSKSALTFIFKSACSVSKPNPLDVQWENPLPLQPATNTLHLQWVSTQIRCLCSQPQIRWICSEHQIRAFEASHKSAGFAADTKLAALAATFQI
jgi:hypothetical protein